MSAGLTSEERWPDAQLKANMQLKRVKQAATEYPRCGGGAAPSHPLHMPDRQRHFR